MIMEKLEVISPAAIVWVPAELASMQHIVLDAGYLYCSHTGGYDSM